MEIHEADRPELTLGVYAHFKGNRYRVIELVRHSETEEWLVLYHPLDNPQSLWVRPYEMFVEQVSKPDYDGPRFRRVGD